jgi:two-component system, OmpR family, response regulator ChvI
MEGCELPKIVCVDDEESLRTALVYSLEKAGYTVTAFPDGYNAWEEMQNGLPDMAVIDIMMPKMDGLDLCRKLRSVSETLPIIFLTSKDEEIDRVLGLELGADDYLCKPFSMRELLTRIKVLFRRIDAYRDLPAAGIDGTKLTAGPLRMDKDRFTVTWREFPVPLTVTEYRILESLAGTPGRVWNREQLLAAAYPEDLYVSDRSVDSHIKRLRKKIQTVDAGFSCIEAIYGLGYKFIPPAE